MKTVDHHSVNCYKSDDYNKKKSYKFQKVTNIFYHIKELQISVHEFRIKHFS